MFFVLIPFLAGLLFGLNELETIGYACGLNPLFGGSAFRTPEEDGQWLKHAS